MKEKGINKFRTVVFEVSYFMGYPVIYIIKLILEKPSIFCM